MRCLQADRSFCTWPFQSANKASPVCLTITAAIAAHPAPVQVREGRDQRPADEQAGPVPAGHLQGKAGVERKATRSAFSLAVQQSPAGATCRRPCHLALPRASHSLVSLHACWPAGPDPGCGGVRHQGKQQAARGCLPRQRWPGVGWTTRANRVWSRGAVLSTPTHLCRAAPSPRRLHMWSWPRR